MVLMPLKHFNATSLDEAVSVLAEYREKASVIAGGTDLLGGLKDTIHPKYPELLLNIKTISDLAYIKEDAEGLKIGALTRLHDIEKNKTITEKYSVLAEAAHSVASPQIRNMGTIAGNICQETRCWYYRNPESMFQCIRKGGKTCNAVTGENRYHSIFGAARVVSPPCSSSCPGNVDIPLYMSRIRDGKLVEAAKILLDCNPIPAITGRVCPHLCEQECNRGEFDEAISIRSIERFIGDYVLENANEIIKLPETSTRKRVAIVGSGPAGLSAAYYLRKLGYRVTLFDTMEEAGGMLTYSIPAYRLPKDVVRKQIKALENMGIEFRLKTNVGKDITLENLRKGFDSVFLASGAWGQPPLGIEDEELLISGLEFLTKVNLGFREPPGRRILVIGGGNVAVDVAITTLRLGAEQVTMACLESREEMPAIQREVEQGVKEGVKLMPSWGPFRILKTNGKISGMELVRCTSVFNTEGNFSPTFDTNIKVAVEVDQIVLAIGQKTALSFLDPKCSLKVERDLIAVDQQTQKTNIPGVFAGGDLTSGPASVIKAVTAGRRAAEAIDLYLKGRGTAVEDKEPVELFEKFNSAYLKKTSRVEVPELPKSKRGIDIEDILGLGLNEIKIEANRCFNCGCVAVSPSDIAPALVALDAKIKTTKRTVEAANFFAAKTMKSTMLDPDELVTELQIPTPKPSSRQIFIKFRLRKSIDFSIVAVASVIKMDSGKVNDARIVLGAVAPIPLRIKEVEDFLKGRETNEEVAEAASAIAVKGANPLAKNKYKVQITKALVKRVILAAG
jgi:NADPH-dependent glutamate synthase beta subunit-like oxidoreductase